MSASPTQRPSPAYSWLLSSLTPPLLCTLIGCDVLLVGLVQVGQASEEVFRGDRLPLLPLPSPPQDNN
ncbi:hypothetical protein OOK60_01455 [Trichothermofontia sichuanensis B231]|uniref:hypothetical protein n=1 Tax=Trichothermofontia sichuanensis TaxID=3045816 RepID=UPI0022465497|nr:hypothetical protein [Trichothermofontia sichuanensis]UZQ54777.1 hypothetical protein OOK60_01455 [Trichothermofontia sichuanensis B231]